MARSIPVMIMVLQWNITPDVLDTWRTGNQKVLL